MAQGKWASAAEGVTSDQSDGREGKVNNSSQQREEAVRVCPRVRVSFIQLQALIGSMSAMLWINVLSMASMFSATID